MARCKLGALLLDGSPMPAEDRALLTRWCTSGEDERLRAVSADNMARALSTEGHPVGPTTCKDHRARRCACYRKDTDA